MYRLFDEYSDQVEFINLDFDNPDHQQAARDLGMRSRSTYFLYDGEGNLIGQWFGPIGTAESAIAADIEGILANR